MFSFFDNAKGVNYKYLSIDIKRESELLAPKGIELPR